MKHLSIHDVRKDAGYEKKSVNDGFLFWLVVCLLTPLALFLQWKDRR